jgi:hypothetical protein
MTAGCDMREYQTRTDDQSRPVASLGALPERTNEIDATPKNLPDQVAASISSGSGGEHTSLLKRMTTSRSPQSRSSVLQLQRSHGNRYVQQWLDRQDVLGEGVTLRKRSLLSERQDFIQRTDGEDDGSERSRQSRPRNAPTGTVPIDQTGKSREDIHKIKDGVGAGPRDWVGISPDGDVITTDGEGNAENHGPADDYLPRTSDVGEEQAHRVIPRWVWGLISVAAAAAIVACFATGVCEFAALVTLIGGATAALVIGILRAAGITDSGAQASVSSEESSSNDEEQAA